MVRVTFISANGCNGSRHLYFSPRHLYFSPDTVRWLKRDTQAEISRRVASLIASEKDQRLQVSARVRLAGESQTQLARELGYADATGVHRAVARLEARAKADAKLRQRMEGFRKALSNVKV